MAVLANLARMSTATTGTGTITLGSAIASYMTFADAGITDGQTVTYAISDGSNREIGRGVYTASGTTLTRSVLKSVSGGVAGTSAISLSGNAEVAISPAAEDFSAASGALVLITETVTSSSAAHVTFSGISSSYRDLVIKVRGRSDAAGGNKDRNLQIQINGDTGSNYVYTAAYIQNGGAGAVTSGVATTQMIVGLLPSGAATANYSGTCIITISDYKGTTFFKNVASYGGGVKAAAAGDENAQIANGIWLSTSAITSVKVYFDSGNFVDNSVVSLYGHA